jgi:hypothetical protein
MKKMTWNLPITVEDPETGAPRTVKTVRQAQSVLHDHWPDTSGSRYRAAEAACDSVMHGEADTDKARKAFIDAAIEAHLHLH